MSAIQVCHVMSAQSPGSSPRSKAPSAASRVDRLSAVADAPRDLKEGAVVVVVANVQAGHERTGLGKFTQYRGRVSHLPRHLTVDVDTGTRSQFVR